eukprot:CAMPEP_0181315056 /NCGR_PEP_ID=MMETSP1101-20121128/15160_1 /TAXON_ID=46948 /ORGANISM="Rhodomonas abbreviata, Strain Caron Lab Isolate" /LENGTH=158 /DNA_ID=CAMNT_0023422215 /DNA_START=153 /DNA_END=629 /DNA_ORIENTATION=+
MMVMVVGLVMAASVSSFPLREESHEHDTQKLQTLREDITNPAIKSAYVSKFNQVKKEHAKKAGEERKKARSHAKLHDKHGDEVTASGHKPSVAPEDEAEHFMNMLPWILPVVCLSILVLVGIGAKMCQAGNYKHTAALKEGGVQPTFKYGGPIGAGPM